MKSIISKSARQAFFILTTFSYQMCAVKHKYTFSVDHHAVYYWGYYYLPSDVQGPARSRRAPAAGPSKPELSQALLNGPVGLRARLALEEAMGRAIEPRLSSVNEVKPCPQCLIPTLACKSKFDVLSNFGTPVVM